MVQTRGYCNDAVYLCDLSQCQPPSALTRGPRQRGAWKVFDYETQALRGNMLHATMLAGAQEVTLPLLKDGWHGLRARCKETQAQSSPFGVLRWKAPSRKEVQQHGFFMPRELETGLK